VRIFADAAGTRFEFIDADRVDGARQVKTNFNEIMADSRTQNSPTSISRCGAWKAR
jgi:hypothetical protein